MTRNYIKLRGVRVHNLKNVDTAIPRQQMVVVCGVSGSGKTSLALDTLYAEGQRRYIESFSSYTRQFLERLPRPAADEIEGLPPAIAVTHKQTAASSRATVGTSTEILDYARLLYARLGRIRCLDCHRVVQRDRPESAGRWLSELPCGTRFMLVVEQILEAGESLDARSRRLREAGYARWIVGHRLLTTADTPRSGPETEPESPPTDPRIGVVLDRLVAGQTPEARLRESLEQAFELGRGQFLALVDGGEVGTGPTRPSSQDPVADDPTWELDGRIWRRVGFSDRLACGGCGREYAKLEPRLFNFNCPLGACPHCEGFGNVMDIDADLVVPQPQKSLAEGAVAPWNTPAHQQELQRLLGIADDCGIPVHVPYRELSEAQRQIIWQGLPERGYRGLNGFFAALESRAYKMHVRVFLSRWRSYRVCEACRGNRLRPEALAVEFAELNLADFCRLKVSQLAEYLRTWKPAAGREKAGGMLLDQIESRLRFLEMVGLGYLSLSRSLRTLSAGESQRVALTSVLGSNLVQMLYVLDEPSVGLHPQNTRKLLQAVEQLRDRGNTVVLVEHEEAIIRAADHVIEMGPGAGEDGGRITFEGSPAVLCQTEGILTGDYLAGRRGFVVPERRRAPEHGWIRITGASGNNLKGIDVDFPLGLLCVVTGVSGAGKSSLVEQTLYPALCQRKRKEGAKPLPFREVLGDGQIEDVLLIDQAPIGRSPRSNPVTYIKAFDAVRAVFAETLAARTRNLKASHFSFNVEGGRCEACQGDGTIAIDMQFLADVVVVCSTCRGTRYRRDILEITYRGKNVAQVLDMTVRQAYNFFRGKPKVQNRLQQLMAVGLDYLRLGQPANTLSAGEAQRLKLAGYLSTPRRGRTLFLLDEPTTGLHFSDVVQLLDCFDALLHAGHSLIVIEHNLQVIQAADYLLDLGPGADDAGGTLVAQGIPEHIATQPHSATGRALAETFARHPMR